MSNRPALSDAEGLANCARIIMPKPSAALIAMILLCPLAAFVPSGSAAGADDAASAHPYLAPHFERVLIARPATGPIVIDGRIDAAWQTAEELSGFYSGRRKEILSPATHVRVAYDEANVYFLIRCDEDANYSYSVRPGDLHNPEAWQDDCVELFLDPQYAQSEFYQFTVSAGSGWLQNRRDLPWQAAWQRAAKIGKGGYVVEIAIPFEAFGLSSKSARVWGVNFARNRIAGKQESTFAPIVRGHKAAERFQQIAFVGKNESPEKVEAIRNSIRRDAMQRYQQRETRRTALSGPRYEPSPGEIKLELGKRIEIAGRTYEITELSQPENRMPAYPFYYDVYDRPEWKQMRDRYDFDEFVGDATDEVEILTRIRDWVVRTVKTARDPAPTTMDLFDILDKSIAGEKFFCQHQVQAFAQIAASYGLQVRVIGCPGHIAAEAWVDQLGKWVWMDARHNFHFEKDGTPLSVIEMRREYWKNGLADCKLLRGLDRKEVFHSGDKARWGKTWKSYFIREGNSPLNRFKYSWTYSTNANDFFARKREHSPALRYLLCDPVIDEQMIAADANEYARRLKIRGAYGYSDINASADQQSWTLNTVTLHAYPVKKGSALPAPQVASEGGSEVEGLEFRFETYTPNFEKFEIASSSQQVVPLQARASSGVEHSPARANSGAEHSTAWENSGAKLFSVKGEPYIWRPAMGKGFTVRAVNKFHRQGRPTTITLTRVPNRQAD